MKITLADKFIAYLALFSGLTISAVAIWYSVAGLVSIFAAAVIPIIVMGVVLEVSKLIATVWLKLNWSRAPVFIRSYLLASIAILMLITSMGIFGFLSKAHSDAGLVGGDVQAKIAVYDEKIKTAKDNIDANRKALKQMDEAVDQVMGRSADEKGADKAVGFKGEALKLAWGIVMRESRGGPTAHNGNANTGDNSYGLFQINMIGGLGTDRREKYGLATNDDLFDPVTNARIAFLMSGGGEDFGAWGVGKNAYNGGKVGDLYTWVSKFPSN